MKISATRLRQNLYQILDQVLEKGIQVEIERKGHILKIVPEHPVNKIDSLENHNVIEGKPESIIHMNWQKYWKGDKNL